VTSIRELLSRIRWDPAFGRGVFVIGYEDHVAGGIVRVPFSATRSGGEDRCCLALVDAHGVERTIPYHRVREVLRDGAVIWHRAP
jgi:uncharacterized protein (UPF0248 family)